jgi:hypothetical protein
MKKEYKQLVEAYLSYAFGFWTILYSSLIFSAIFLEEKEQKVKTMLSGESGLIIGIFMIAFLAFLSGIPYYIWIALREAMLKEKLNTKNLYKYSFLAGGLIPPTFCIIIWTLMGIGLKNENLTIFIPLIFIIGFAECCIRINKINEHQIELPNSDTAAAKSYIFSEPRVKSGVGATTPEEERRGCVVLTPNERGLLNMYAKSK